jgi:hypothetical protein
MSTLATVTAQIERDFQAFARITEEVGRSMEVATRTQRQAVQAIADAAKLPNSVAKAIEDVLRSARESASITHAVAALSRPDVPLRAHSFFAQGWATAPQPDEPDRPRLPFGFHPQH